MHAQKMPLGVISSSQLNKGLIFTSLHDIVMLVIVIVRAREYQLVIRLNQTFCVDNHNPFVPDVH